MMLYYPLIGNQILRLTFAGVDTHIPQQVNVDDIPQESPGYKDHLKDDIAFAEGEVLMNLKYYNDEVDQEYTPQNTTTSELIMRPESELRHPPSSPEAPYDPNSPRMLWYSQKSPDYVPKSPSYSPGTPKNNLDSDDEYWEWEQEHGMDFTVRPRVLQIFRSRFL